MCIKRGLRAATRNMLVAFTPLLALSGVPKPHHFVTSAVSRAEQQEERTSWFESGKALSNSKICILRNNDLAVRAATLSPIV